MTLLQKFDDGSMRVNRYNANHGLVATWIVPGLWFETEEDE